MAGRYDPVKCPDCGTWWRGEEHRCARTFIWPGSPFTNQQPASYTVTCNCAFDPKGYRIATSAACPVHDVQVTFTSAVTCCTCHGCADERNHLHSYCGGHTWAAEHP